MSPPRALGPLVAIALLAGCASAWERLVAGPPAPPGTPWPTPTLDALGERGVDVLDDPGVLLPSEDLPLPTPSPSPTVPPADAGIPRRVAFGWDRLYGGQLALAQEAFDGVTAEAPDRWDAWLGAGLARLFAGEADAAAPLVAAAAQRAPQTPEPAFYLGYLAYLEDDLAEAVRRWTALAPTLASRPPGGLDHAHAVLLARALLAQGDRAAAAQWARRALAVGGGGPTDAPRGPELTPERRPDGSLPAADFQWIRPLPTADPASGIALLADGGAWQIHGDEPFRQRLDHPPPGSWDDALAPGPGGQVAVIRRGAAGRRLVVVDAGGAERAFDEWDLAPMAPAWRGPGEILAVGRGADGREGLLVFDAATGEVRPWGALPGDPAVADPLVLPDGAVVASVARGGTLRLARIRPGAAPAWLTDVPAAADPFLRARPTREAPPLPETPAPEATPLPLDDPFARARRAPAPATRPSPPPVPASPWRTAWSPEDGPRVEDTPTPTMAPRLLAPRVVTGAPTPTPPPGPSLPAGAASTPAPRGEDAPLGDERQAALGPGGQIAFSRMAGATRRIWILDPAAGRQRPVTDPAQDCWAPAFVPGGAALLMTCQRGAMTRILALNLGNLKSAEVFADASAVRGAVPLPEGWPAPVTAPTPTPTPVATPTPAPTPSPAPLGPPIFLKAPR